MKWEDFKKDVEVYELYPQYVPTDIECPKCGKQIYEDTTIEYLTNPPKHDYYCFSCGWSGRK